MLVRPATVSDQPSILAIQAASPEASGWDPSAYDCWIAELEGAVAGFLAARTTAPGEHEVLNLAVAPSARRSGVAKALVKFVLDGRPGDWFLEVRESNRPARALYESAGFRPCGIRKNYYDNPPEGAIVMRLQS